MTKAKVHIEAGLFGKAACGKRNVDVTKDLILVTCANCQRDSAYREWIADQDLERSGVVGQP